MLTISDLQHWLADFAPPRLAADWDNVGLLVGDATRAVSRVMTCLTVTAESAAEAIREGAELIVTHHPFPFSATKRITSETHTGRLLLSLIEARIAVLSPHTAFDSARVGINRRLAERLGLEQVRPLIVTEHDALLGTGRQGAFAGTLGELAARACAELGLSTVQLVGAPARRLERVAVGCGSAGELLDAARAEGCDCFVTGEARFHTALEAQAAGMTMLLLGHYASERFALEELALRITDAYPELECWASRDEADPIGYFSPGF
jgi:dinuclear metal center YbgI/SA1388 family protein